MQLKSIDVAIGMAFLYLLLTFVAGALVELISNIFNWRAQLLHAAIEKMLRGTGAINVNSFYEHPLVTSLATNREQHSRVDLLDRTGWRAEGDRGTPPAYIPAAVFSAILLESIRYEARDKSDLSPDEEVKTVVRWTQEIADRPSALRSIVQNALATQGYSIQAVKLAVEKWFNDAMERTSGWYKRRTRSMLLLIGLGLALFGNIDSIAVAKWLWDGDAARQAVVAAAADYVKNTPAPKAPATPVSGASSASLDPSLKAVADQVALVDRRVGELGYPIGMSKFVSDAQSDQAGFLWLMQYLLGCVISAIAISMGSPFWFDAMQNLLKLRGTGPKPGAR